MKARLRSEQGFGLIELLIAMMVLNLGILAIVAAFNSGALAMRRASQTSTGSVLADKQMELYRALNWSAIGLRSGAATVPGSVAEACANATYAAGLTPCATQVLVICATLAPECTAMQTGVTGPDGRPYRIDTYIVEEPTVVGATPSGRPVKRVTVVVRHPTTLKAISRVTSSFDQSTG